MKHLCKITYEYETYSGYTQIAESCQLLTHYARMAFEEYDSQAHVFWDEDTDYLDVILLVETEIDIKEFEQKLRTLPKGCVSEGLVVTYLIKNYSKAGREGTRRGEFREFCVASSATPSTRLRKLEDAAKDKAASRTADELTYGDIAHATVSMLDALAEDDDDDEPGITFDEAKLVHDCATRNRTLVKQSQTCGCYCCASIFPASAVTDYIDGGQTALCPECGTDSVIADASRLPITMPYLQKMRQLRF